MNLLELPVVVSKPKNLFEIFQRDMRNLYKNRTKQIAEQLLRVRCPSVVCDIVSFENPSGVQDIFIEWLFTDTINEEKTDLRRTETQQLFREALEWVKLSHANKFGEFLFHLVTNEISHLNCSDFSVLFHNEPIIMDR